MTATAPIRVVATHDIRQRFDPPIKAGTPGEIIDVGGAPAVSYTVVFRLPDGGLMTLRDLSRMDLREV